MMFIKKETEITVEDLYAFISADEDEPKLNFKNEKQKDKLFNYMNSVIRNEKNQKWMLI